MYRIGGNNTTVKMDKEIVIREMHKLMSPEILMHEHCYEL